MPSKDARPVTDNREESRFEAETSAGLAVLEYRRDDKRLTLIHTEVPKPARERGVGTRLIEAAFEAARREGLTIVPHCPFVRAYLKKHPEVSVQVERR